MSEGKGEITIRVSGKVDGAELTPDNFDIALLKSVLDETLAMLYPDNKRNRPLVTYEMRDGSVRNVFKTTIQKAAEFAAVLVMISANGGSIDGLEPGTARAIENYQEFARQSGLDLEISTSSSPKGTELLITPHTNYKRNADLWIDAELYLYGTLVDAGGKNKASIRLDTKDGLYVIKTDRDYLSGITGNPLYREYGARVLARQNIATRAVDKQDMRLVGLIDYSPKYDAHYIDKLINEATPVWHGIDADEYVHSVRGGYYGE